MDGSFPKVLSIIQVKLLAKKLESSKKETPYEYYHLPVYQLKVHYEVLGRKLAEDSFENNSIICGPSVAEGNTG